MTYITINLSDSQLQALRDLANAQGVEVDTLLRASLVDWLTSQKTDFLDAADTVLTKNSELYRRLA